MAQPFKRIATDAAGYGMILLGIAFGWLPGPGGIPLVLGGLGLLSINNRWAARLRDWIIHNSATFLKKIFPEKRIAQILYDTLSLILLAVAAWLAWKHDAVWKISLSIALLCIALVIAGMNRGRADRIKKRLTGS